MTESLAFQVAAPASGEKPAQLVVLLHGLGANGADLLSLAPYWAPQLPDAVFVAPDAPFPCDMAPVGYQWFSLQNRSLEAMEKGARAVAPILNRFLDEQLTTYQLPAHKLALVGFSQGTMMSLYVAPRRRPVPAAVVGYSGALIAPAILETETTTPQEGSYRGFPILLVHGDADPVVPFMALDHAAKGLRGAGYRVTTLARPGLGHSIDAEGLAAGAVFLRRSFGLDS
ncbi:MAG: dienelactone hydrolase family protein [Alphaproteobacteria bacterium]